MYHLTKTSLFKKDLKRVYKRNASDFEKAAKLLRLLENKGVGGIPKQMKAHKLKGNTKATGNAP